jgi:hypothetical protein
MLSLIIPISFANMSNENKQMEDNYLYLRNIPPGEEKNYDIHHSSIRFITFPPMDGDQMIDFSDFIIRGHVKEITCRWNTADQKTPAEKDMDSYNLCTDVEITVDEIYKGKIDEKEITIHHWGGFLDNSLYITDSYIDYYKGEEVILYLVREETNDTAEP